MCHERLIEKNEGFFNEKCKEAKYCGEGQKLPGKGPPEGPFGRTSKGPPEVFLRKDPSGRTRVLVTQSL